VNNVIRNHIGAGVVGIALVGFGLWWADAVAAGAHLPANRPGGVFVAPRDGSALVSRIESARQEMTALDWRLHSITGMPVARPGDGPLLEV
jgi:hypothetical protein